MAERDAEPRMPTTDQPLNAERRGTFGPAVVSLLLLAVIAVVFLVMFLVR